MVDANQNVQNEKICANDHNNLDSELDEELPKSRNCTSDSSAKRVTTVQTVKDKGALQILSEFLRHNVRLDSTVNNKGSLPTIPINDLRGEEASIYSREECVVRRSLAALYRLVDLRGWTHSIYNHISVRLPDNTQHFLINPFGLLYHEIQASSFVKVDDEGNIIQPGSTILGVNKAGWTLHSALHAARPDVNCIIHVHLPDVIAVSCIRAGLLPICPEANELLAHNGVRYHDFHGILVDESERVSIQNDLGSKAKILFLRNHGVVVAAATIPEAWYLIKRVVTACQTQMRMLQLTGGTNLLTEFKDTVASSNEADQINSTQPNGDNLDVGREQSPLLNGKALSESGDASWTAAELEFEAEMRVLDSAGFRTGHVYRQPKLLRRSHAGGSTWAGDTLGDQMSGAELLTTDFSATEFSAADDVAAAEAAGAQQVAKIADSVRANRLKSAQRNQWLSQKPDPTAPGLVTSSLIASPGSMHTSAAFSPVGTRRLIDSPDSSLSMTHTPVRRHLSGGDDTALTMSNGQSPKLSRSAKDSFIVSKSATLPANVQRLTAMNAQNSNTLQYANAEDQSLKTNKKVKKKGSFRIPSFSRKKKH